MRFDVLIERLRASIHSERRLLQRVARYVLPLLLLPVGPAVAQIPTGWIGLIAGGLIALLMIAQAELFIRPTFVRARIVDRDLTSYLGLAPSGEKQELTHALALLLPPAAALLLGMALFLPGMMADAASWQRLVALVLAGLALWAVWQRLAETVSLLDSVEQRLAAAARDLIGGGRSPDDKALVGASDSPARAPSASYRLPEDGLLEPRIARRVVGLPLPPLRLSPAGVALLRTEAYLTLRDFPDTQDRDLIASLNELGREISATEQRHSALPPVGGKIYLPVAAGGAVAALLGATVRRLGMDGAYSASLRTWLVRLPPARSYSVAGRLIDAVVALRILPPGSVVPHHLTVQGDLGREARVLSVLHLAASALVLEERPGAGRDDPRPFIMRGGGVLDDLDGRGRGTGPRTDFVDGFLFVDVPALDAPEHRIGHTLNLRLKQVLAYGLLAAATPSYRRTPLEARAAAVFERLREDMRQLLADHGLEAALEVDWLDGAWSEIWPLIEGLNRAKQRSPQFLAQMQRLRDDALDALEAIAAEDAGTRAERGVL